MSLVTRLLQAAGMPEDTPLTDEVVSQLVRLGGERVQCSDELVQLRDQHRLKLDDLATVVGCSRRAVTNYLNGTRDLTQLQWAAVQELAYED